jgi:hypothetical protein
VTVNSSREDTRNLALQAQAILKQMHGRSGGTESLSADDLLLFCYRLRDGYRIVRSTSARFTGTSFVFLNDLLYQLESRPDETLRSPEWRDVIEVLLLDLSSGRLVLAAKVGR